MIRRTGERVHNGQRYEPRPGAYAILFLDGQLLLTHQSQPRSELQLPGGGIDSGESPLQALHREVLEETGWAIAYARKLGAFRRFAYMPEYDRWAEKVCHIYSARPVMPKSAPREQHHSAVWTAPRLAARILGNEGDRMFVRRLFRLSSL